ncbi:MAG: DNA polymerase III subunit gamma/tau [Marinifilaceae bacterium]
MEDFIVSARKYRPNSFDTVVGQESITSTLKNAINTKHLAHAYLFCGPRGVGKTTCARIFAKTINCLEPTDTGDACNNCESCQAFSSSRSFNIHELDAASNNSVEDIRLLTEKVRIPPQIGKYSVYIIDEVHMLSSSAFNAFLKTLEEPPAHAIFILATTEKQKIIPTILSRCQIYDFNRMSVIDIVKHLQNISKAESVNIDEDSLNVIAQKADGAMRDALSLFDQVVSSFGKEVSYENIITNLNVLDYDYYFKFVNAFLNTKVAEVLVLFNDILSKGFDAQTFVNGIGKHLRNLLVCKDSISIMLLQTSAQVKEKYMTQAELCSQEFLYDALDLVDECDQHYRNATDKRLLVEIALMRLAQIEEFKKKSVAEDASV